MGDHPILYGHASVAIGGMALFVRLFIGAVHASRVLIDDSLRNNCMGYVRNSHSRVMFDGHPKRSTGTHVIQYIKQYRWSSKRSTDRSSHLRLSHCFLPHS